MYRKERGVTLIALVITIIVLIILAGVTITSITGEDSITNETKETRAQAERESIIEKIEADLLTEKTKTGKTPTKDQLKELIKEKEYNKEEPGENDFVTKDGGYTINYDEIIGWKEEEKLPTVGELKINDYVKYMDKKGVERECIVLYDKEYNQKNNTNYGVQIITSDIVENVTLGDENFEKSIESYNNALQLLYNKAQEFLNDKYAINARCVGSKPDEPDWDTEEMFEIDSKYTYMQEFKGKLKKDDTNMMADMGQLILSEELQGKSSFWLASRIALSIENLSYFDINHFDPSGKINEDYLCLMTKMGSRTSDISNEGFRPVFTLKPEVKLLEGDGTKENPYILGI